jgi:hypothetical protein
MKTYFLLGGNDLEMVTIRNILTKYVSHDLILDHQLAWGAKLSDYKGNLNNRDRFVGIELESDMPHPRHYVMIDHHNENSHKASSLIQIIEFLNHSMKIEIPITREYELIAANDVGYIPAMEKIGATQKEIDDIRARDLATQGVTKEMEAIALEEIKQAKQDNGITLVKTTLHRFSPLTDALFPYGELIIYNEREVNYYGSYVQSLVHHEASLSRDSKPNYRLGKPGFWGKSDIKVDQNYIQDILQILKKEMGMENHANVYSYHIFSFPFTLTGKVSDFIKDHRDSWVEQETKAYLTYNENIYFHPFSKEMCEGFESKLTKHYEYSKDPMPSEYCIEVLRKIEPKEKGGKTAIVVDPFKLTIDRITLAINDLGVGVLSFHLQYPIGTDNKPADVLKINQYGRRLFPPFFDMYPSDHNCVDLSGNGPSSLLRGTQLRVLASKITIKAVQPGDGDVKNKTTSIIEEDYSQFRTWGLGYHGGETPPISFSKIIGYFFPNNRSTIRVDSRINNSGLTDDRMFVTSWFGSEQLDLRSEKRRYSMETEKKQYKSILSDIFHAQIPEPQLPKINEPLKPYRSSAKEAEPGYLGSSFWYAYLFVDGSVESISCQNWEMQKEYIRNQTYARWYNYKVLFGVSRYSFVCLTDTLENLHKPGINAAFLVDHVQTIYFSMVQMILIQRALLIKFSNDAADISSKTNKLIQEYTDNSKDAKKSIYISKDFKEKVNEIDSIMGHYNTFINQVFLREVTSQDQGIELYDMIQKQLRIEYQAKELEKELVETHRLAELIRSRQSEAFKHRLELLGILLVVPTLVFELLHTHLLGEPQLVFVNFLSSILNFELITVLVTIVSLVILIRRLFRVIEKKACRFCFVIIIITVFLLLYPMILIGNSLNKLEFWVSIITPIFFLLLDISMEKYHRKKIVGACLKDYLKRKK